MDEDEEEDEDVTENNSSELNETVFADPNALIGPSELSIIQGRLANNETFLVVDVKNDTLANYRFRDIISEYQYAVAEILYTFYSDKQEMIPPEIVKINVKKPNNSSTAEVFNPYVDTGLISRDQMFRLFQWEFFGRRSYTLTEDDVIFWEIAWMKMQEISNIKPRTPQEGIDSIRPTVKKVEMLSVNTVLNDVEETPVNDTNQDFIESDINDPLLKHLSQLNISSVSWKSLAYPPSGWDDFKSQGVWEPSLSLSEYIHNSCLMEKEPTIAFLVSVMRLAVEFDAGYNDFPNLDGILEIAKELYVSKRINESADSAKRKVLKVNLDLRTTAGGLSLRIGDLKVLAESNNVLIVVISEEKGYKVVGTFVPKNKKFKKWCKDYNQEEDSILVMSSCNGWMYHVKS